MGTKNNPAKHDCYAAAAPDEPYFTLLGRDPVAAATIAFWCILRDAIGKAEPEKTVEAMACATQMEEWAAILGKAEQVEHASIVIASMLAKLEEPTIRMRAASPSGPGDAPTDLRGKPVVTDVEEPLNR
jgi:hypothetical protein